MQIQCSYKHIFVQQCSEKRRTAVLRSSRYIRTVKPLNDGRGVYPTYAHDSLRTDYVSKLAMACERDLEVTHDWNSALMTGDPVRSDLVTQYIAFIREEQKKAGVAHAMLHSHLTAILVHMALRLRCAQDPY